MAVDLYLIDRMRRILESRLVAWYEKKMFGGRCFMVDEKMCFVARRNGGLMVRIDPAESEALLTREGASQMVHGNRTMSGFLYLTPEACAEDAELEFWLDKCLEYNPRARASKKKKR
ncbi:TfoX/Sxy family protein [Flavilitoribacter nigricans]|uniref:RNA methyltransferase n=1 Tax=Flavilitoribacter nigricans (strain ATCC 23147 / DSM 23189 / NBRC 102662 / NCIMB 1420 / SS-2) TaxID=1122177 RepID=A0A2D0NHL4_FLAN2|nr:TfoX/Sxy family protein [Flavilitoribacter nigricans]PHN07908.1 RNA methyltransferase [Flavilitoribacter nigricans DSM 23189 = NBRC 102662]